ncbi:hypothetical protein [Enterovibrio norvegicus]|uniref:Uncharacterized protein n=1 Tax=Enterovibrio norvegicus TaxID=188144 RepID=A0ABV4L820_9GAMM
MERIVEEEDVYEQQFLEKPRKGKWTDAMVFDAKNVVPTENDVSDRLHHSVEAILAEIEDAHLQHGKPLRLVRVKRTTITEIEVIKEFRK